MKIILLRLLIRVVKLSFIGIFLQCLLFELLLAGNIEAQKYSSVKEVIIDINVKNASVIQLFKELEQKTDFYFTYDEKVLSNNNEKFNIVGYQKSVEEILLQISEHARLRFKQINNNINVSPLKDDLKEKPIEVIIQGITITGRVSSSEDDAGLPGVNVIIKGTTKGTITDAEGNFSLQVEKGDILVFSYVGYVTREIVVGDQTVIDVKLIPALESLSEIVVIGYGSVRKSDLTGSVSSVESEDMNIYPTSNVVQALQGRAAGVQIQADNGGEPGGNYDILIRGISSVNASSEPMYVVDGYPQATLPPADDVESVEVLKDASATAIYGSRGANGVILITTKKGKTGKMRVNFNPSYSIQKDIKRYDLLNAEQYANLINEVNESNGQPPFFDNPASLGEGTDWQNEILQNGNTQNYNLSIAGGTDKIDYYVSGVFFDQRGIIVNSDYKRYSLTTNLDIKPSKRVKIGLNVFLKRDEQNRLSTQEGTTSIIGGGVVSTALMFAPSSSIYNDDGTYTLHPIGIPFDNPVAIANERSSQRLTDYMNANLSGEFELFKGFIYKIVLGSGTTNGRFGNYLSSKLYYGGLADGIAEVSSNKYSNLLAENYVTYSRDFNEVHTLSVMAGYSYQKFTSEGIGVTATGFISDAFLWWNLNGAANAEQPYSSIVKSELSSFYGRLNYSLLGRYLFTLNGRYDGSSKFAANNKWAFFPSGAFAWNIHKEEFMKDSKVFSELKLRASYGASGNQAIRPYQSLGKLTNVFAVVNGKKVNAVRPLTVTNNNLTWESSIQTDIGLDFGFLQNKLTFTADYYNKVTKDLLFNVPLPEYTGFRSQLKNIGKLENKGFEFAVQANDIGNAFKWNSKFNITLNKNKILKLPEGNDILYTTAPGQFSIHTSQIMREGEPLGTFYGYIYEGVQQSDDELLDGAEGLGGERFKDLNGDGVLDDQDRTIIGNPNPDFYWGWNNYFTFKNFELNIFFVGVQGNEMLNYTRMGLDCSSGIYNATTALLDRWTPTHTETDVPKAANRPTLVSTRWVEDASYIRLENILIGYSFPKKIIDKIRMRQLRIYVSAQKPWIITKYKGFDPEVNWSTGNMNIGLDYGSYPNVRSFTMGLNIGF